MAGQNLESSEGEEQNNSGEEPVSGGKEAIYFGYTTKQLTTILIFGFANLFSCTIYALQAPFYPKEAESKGATATEYGFVLGIFQLVIFIMSPIYGTILGFVNPRLVFNLGICVTAICAILFGFLDYVDDHVTFIALSFVLRILQACGDAAFVTASFAIIAMEFPEAIATTFATFETFSGIGLILGPSLGGVLYQVGGFLLPFLFMGGCLFLVVLLTYFTLPELKKTKGDEQEKQNNGTRKSGVVAMLKIPTVALGFFSLFISATSIGFLVATLEPHLRENFGLTPAITGAVFMIDGAMYALSAPLWGKLCDNTSQIHIYTIIGAVMTFAGFLLIGPAPFIPLPTLLWLICVGLVIHGLGTGASFVASFLLALKGSINNGFPEGIATYGLVSGLYTSSLASGSFVGPSVGGVLLDHYGFKIGSLFVLVTQVVIIFVASLFFCVPRKFESSTDTTDSEKESLLEREQSSANVYQPTSSNSKSLDYGSI